MGKISCLFGMIKLLFYKLIYGKKIIFDIRQHIHKGIIVNIKGNSLCQLGKNICSYNNCKYN